MVRLRLSTFIAAPVEEVYERLTSYGRQGPLNQEEFQQKHGEILQQDENTFVVSEDVRNYPDDDPELITWRCTFDYPTARSMEAVDSPWAHRRDTLRSVPGGTHWRAQWDPHAGPVRGLIQYLFFLAVRQRRMRRELIDPIKEHFESSR